MKLVVIESPYAGNPKRNLLYLDYCIRDCLAMDESPYASHLMLTTALDDNDPNHRALGIAAGLEWRMRADDRIFYTDLGWSRGMVAARNLYDKEGLLYTRRYLPPADLREFQRESHG